VRSVRLLALGAFSAAVASCAGTNAESPLYVKPGTSRDSTTIELRRHAYCLDRHPPVAKEIYQRCDRPGTEQGDAWVEVNFDHDKMVELRRYERYSDSAVASQRWNELAQAHCANSAAVPGDQAKQTYRSKQPIPNGVQRWMAATVGNYVVAVFLLTPGSADEPSLLEHIVE
jgi:hypothetical protein